MDSLKELFKIGNGPSSSHTIGPERAAKKFKERTPNTEKYVVELYGSLALTGKGHLTDWIITETLKPAETKIVWMPEVVYDYHTNGMKFKALDNDGNVTEEWVVFSVGGGTIMELDQERRGPSKIYPYSKMDDIKKWCEEGKKEYWEYVVEYEGEEIFIFLKEIWDAMATAVERGKSKKVAGLVQEALDSGASAPEILNAMIDSMTVVGDKFTKNEIFVPEMLVAARAMQKGVEVLKPLLVGDNAVSAGKMIMGTVAGDLHDIGKNLVIMMLESAGFEVIDLGVDVPAEKFIEALEENPDVKIVGASALLTTTMEALKDTVKALNEYPGRDKIKVMVGGAPITQEFADEIGADAYTEDAASAAQVAKKLATSVSVPA